MDNKNSLIMQKFDKTTSNDITKTGRSNIEYINSIIENGGKLKFLPTTEKSKVCTFGYKNNDDSDFLDNIFGNIPTVKYKQYNVHPREVKKFLRGVFEMKDCDDKSFLKSYFHTIHGIHIDIYFGAVKVDKRYSFTIDGMFSSTCENIKTLESMKVPMTINVPQPKK